MFIRPVEQSDRESWERMRRCVVASAGGGNRRGSPSRGTDPRIDTGVGGPMTTSTQPIKGHHSFAITWLGRFTRPILLFCLLMTPVNGIERANGSEWIAALPEEVGVDSTALAEMFDYIRQHNLPVHSVQIVRGGRLILDAYFYPYNAKMRHDIASVTKCITS